MTIEKIIGRIKAFGEKYDIPVTEYAFEETEENPVPDLPYLVYFITRQKNRGADMVNNIEEIDFSLELYTDKYSNEREDLEFLVEREVLHDVENEKYIATIEKENMVQSAWEINGMIQKKGANK